MYVSPNNMHAVPFFFSWNFSTFVINICYTWLFYDITAVMGTTSYAKYFLTLLPFEYIKVNTDS